MQTTDKVQTGDTVKGTSTSTSTTYTYSNSSYSAEKGWECPRCGRINAPWVRQCDCSPSTSKITVNPCDKWDKITINPHDKWWNNQITFDDNMFRIHPESITYTTNVNQVVGGSDYKDSATGAWVNVPKTHTNSVKR